MKVQRKTIIRCFSLFFIFLICSTGLFTEEEDLLTIEASLSPRRLSKGQEGKVILKIFVKPDITINPQPQFIIEFEPSEEIVFPKNFFTASDLEVEILRDNGFEYLNLEKPLEIPFSVNLKAARGNHTLEGRIKYFACSNNEGWCLKRSSRFSASFYTRDRVYPKKK